MPIRPESGSAGATAWQCSWPGCVAHSISGALIRLPSRCPALTPLHQTGRPSRRARPVRETTMSRRFRAPPPAWICCRHRYGGPAPPSDRAHIPRGAWAVGCSLHNSSSHSSSLLCGTPPGPVGKAQTRRLKAIADDDPRAAWTHESKYANMQICKYARQYSGSRRVMSPAHMLAGLRNAIESHQPYTTRAAGFRLARPA